MLLYTLALFLLTDSDFTLFRGRGCKVTYLSSFQGVNSYSLTLELSVDMSLPGVCLVLWIFPLF